MQKTDDCETFDNWHLAQLNIARALHPADDPRMREFYARLDEINALADTSPGFVWRLAGESGNATAIEVDGDPSLIVNMSVWQSVEALFDFAYRSAHKKVMSKRRQWFSRPQGQYQVLWWIPAGHRPTLSEGMARLDELNTRGTGPRAFSFKSKFAPPGCAGEPEDLKPEPYCSNWD